MRQLWGVRLWGLTQSFPLLRCCLWNLRTQEGRTKESFYSLMIIAVLPMCTLACIWNSLRKASCMKLSVMSPKTMHMSGSTTPFAIDITVPAIIIKTSQRSANLNCTQKKNNNNLSGKKLNSKQLSSPRCRSLVEFTETTGGCASLPSSPDFPVQHTHLAVMLVGISSLTRITINSQTNL